MKIFIKYYAKSSDVNLVKDWIEVPRIERICLVEETLPIKFLEKMNAIGLKDEIFNNHISIPNKNKYKERLENNLKKYPIFEEFIFESCHWNNVIYNDLFVNDIRHIKIYKNSFEYLYYVVFKEPFPREIYEEWSKKNNKKTLSDFVRFFKFNKVIRERSLGSLIDIETQKKELNIPEELIITEKIESNSTEACQSNIVIESFSDIEGNIYKTVQIGNQLWMAENLRVSHYRNGDLIKHVKDSSDWNSLTKGAYCNVENILNFGNFYNWYTIDDQREIAPIGWHIPNFWEWKQLHDMLEFEVNNLSHQIQNGEINTEEPYNSLIFPIYDCGFSPVEIGCMGVDGILGDEGMYGYWWSSTEDSGNSAFSVDWFKEVGSISINSSMKNFGFSIRCIKDYKTNVEENSFSYIKNQGTNNDYQTHESKWSNYNDDKDMDQQSEDFWNQF